MFPTVIKSLYEEPLSIQNLIMEMWDFLWAYTFLQNYLPFFLACKHFPIAPETPINKFIKLVLSRKKKDHLFLIFALVNTCAWLHTHTHPSLCLQFIDLLHTWKQIYVMGVMMQIWRIRDRYSSLAKKGKERKEYSQSGWRRAG